MGNIRIKGKGKLCGVLKRLINRLIGHYWIGLIHFNDFILYSSFLSILHLFNIVFISLICQTNFLFIIDMIKNLDY
jgi:hypothetical protein